MSRGVLAAMVVFAAAGPARSQVVLTQFYDKADWSGQLIGFGTPVDRSDIKAFASTLNHVHETAGDVAISPNQAVQSNFSAGGHDVDKGPAPNGPPFYLTLRAGGGSGFLANPEILFYQQGALGSSTVAFTIPSGQFFMILVDRFATQVDSTSVGNGGDVSKSVSSVVLNGTSLPKIDIKNLVSTNGVTKPGISDNFDGLVLGPGHDTLEVSAAAQLSAKPAHAVQNFAAATLELTVHFKPVAAPPQGSSIKARKPR